MESPQISGPKPRILVVEDHADTRLVIERLLARRGYEIVVAESIAEARAKAAECGFDLLISDLTLPDGHGHDLMAELRENCGAIGIALTGHETAEDIARSGAVGFLAHLTKPVDMHALQETIKDALGRKAQS